jgi:hypothetical protein
MIITQIKCASLNPNRWSIYKISDSLEQNHSVGAIVEALLEMSDLGVDDVGEN